MHDRTDLETTQGFDELGLIAPVLAAIREIGYESPSPIQAAAIPPLLEGKDVLGQAQTGTGKTAAFALPLLSRLDVKLAQPQLLVLTPTRELAIQVAEAMQTYARHLKGFHVLPVYGGQGMDFQLKQLRRGVHVVVGTPGRIQDHLRRKTLKLERLKAVVLDEADEMLRMGFIDDVEDILTQMPEDKQVALFSATMPDRIRKIVQHHLAEPVEVKIKAKTATVASVDQRFVEIRGFDKLEALTRILEAEEFDAMLVFVRTRSATTELAEKLEARGLASAALSGEMPQALRERTIDRLKRGKLDIVVATDVAARGLDVDRVTHVVNYDVPHDVESYIHRIGRTGRAGRAGHAILFVMPREMRMLNVIERATRQPVTPMRMPTREAVADRRTVKFNERLTETLASQELGFFENLVASYAAEHGTEPRAIAAALAYLVQKDRPLLPPPEPPRHPAAARAGRSDQRGGAAPRSGGDRRDGGSARAHAAADRGPPPPGMVRYRLAVGHDHGVQPGNIVGAIANEAEIDSKHIGRIRIFDAFSTVELPEGMPADTFERLRKAWVSGQKLALRIDAPAESERPPRAGRAPADGPRAHRSGTARRKDQAAKPAPKAPAPRKPPGAERARGRPPKKA
jgi:ATP-dependent RNA helicase DeaD